MNTLNCKNLNNMPVGFFDSGVGGLSVYAKFRKLIPCENTLYFGDTVNLPYGNKSKKELIGFARRILDFYQLKNVKAVVIACNTSSAQAYEVIKNDYDFKIYPIIQSCARTIGENNEYKRIGVFATAATIKSGVYGKELQKYNSSLEIFEQACPNWVSIVESSKYSDSNSIMDIQEQVGIMMKNIPDRIILGCTHYPYLLSLLKRFAPEEMFIDPADIFVDYIQKDLAKNDLLNSSKINGAEEIFVSSNPNDFVRNAKIFYEVKELPKIV